MKKKVALTAAAVALVGTLAVGGTLAWFTDTEEATNVVTVGDIDVKLSEVGEGTPSQAGTGLEYTNLMPGKTFTKDAYVENVGTNDAYVKAIITLEAKDDNSKKLITDMKESTTNKITFTDLAPNGVWTYDETAGTATYTVWYNGTTTPEVFGTDDEAWHLFTSVVIPEGWDNSYENVGFDIKINVEAIQADNITARDAASKLADAKTAAEGNLDKNKSNDATGSATKN